MIVDIDCDCSGCGARVSGRSLSATVGHRWLALYQEGKRSGEVQIGPPPPRGGFLKYDVYTVNCPECSGIPKGCAYREILKLDQNGKPVIFGEYPPDPTLEESETTLRILP